MADDKDKILLATEKKGTSDKAHDGKNIGTKMTADPDPDVAGKGAKLLSTSNKIETKLLARNALLDDVQDLTGDLEKLEKTWNKDYKAAADKSEEIYPEDSPRWEGYGFDLADVTKSDRPAPPKVTGLVATQGDAIGTGDLVWNPQGKNVNDGYFIEINTTDPIDNGAWTNASPRSVGASKATITGLTTGQKYWVRITAFLNKGAEGTPSDPNAFLAP